jgi:hypothetical protein
MAKSHGSPVGREVLGKYRSGLVQEKGAYAIINRTQVLRKVRY